MVKHTVIRAPHAFPNEAKPNFLAGMNSDFKSHDVTKCNCGTKRKHGRRHRTRLLAWLAFVTLAHGAIGSAQDASAPAAAATAAPAPPDTAAKTSDTPTIPTDKPVWQSIRGTAEKFGGEVVKAIRDNAAKTIGVFIVGLFTSWWAGAWRAFTRGKKQGLVQGLAKGQEEGLMQGLAKGQQEGLVQGLAKGQEEGRGPLRADWPPPQARTHTILLLGSSKKGKTTLVKFLFDYPTDQAGGPEPFRATDNLSVYSMIHETRTDHESRAYRFDIADYRGGKQAQIVKQWPVIGERLLHKQATAVVLMVDLYETGEKLDREEREALDEGHLVEHTQYWTLQLLEIIASVAAPKPKLVVLFINKVDLIDKLSLKSIALKKSRRLTSVTQTLAPLVTNLGSAFGTEVVVIIGSVLYGVGTNELLALLRERSQPPPS